MVNRFGRAVGGTTPFDPKGAIIDGLPAVARGAGQDDEALFSVGSELAGIFGRQADREAQIEGKREGTIAGNDPSFRPTGATTLRGKAYEESATSTYMDNLNAKISGKMLDAYQANKDDPVALKVSFDALKKDILDNDTFPEIAGAINASFERSRLPFQVKALGSLEERQRDQAGAARFRRDEAEGALNARKVEIAPLDAAVNGDVKDWLKQTYERDLAAAGRKEMSFEDVEKRRIRRETEITNRRSTAIIGGAKTLAEVDQAKAAYEADKKAGKLGDVGKNTATMDHFENQLEERRKQLSTGANTAINTTKRLGDDMLERAKRGAPPPPAEVEQLRAVAAATPDGEARVAQFDQRLAWIKRVDAQGPQAAEAAARGLREAAGPTPTKPVAEDIKFLDDLAQARRTETVLDPVGLADRLGVAKFKPLPTGEPAALIPALRERIAAADALPADINPNRKVLDPIAIKEIQRKVEMGGEISLLTIQALVTGAGPDAPRVMAELAGTMPEAAHAGLLLARGGSPEAAAGILGGISLREMAKSGGGAEPPKISPDGIGAALTKVAGKTLRWTPEGESRIKQAAINLSQWRMRSDKSDEINVMEQAVRDVLGERRVDGVTYGGIGYSVSRGQSWSEWVPRVAVIVPSDVRQDSFGTAMSGLDDGMLKGLASPPAAGETASALKRMYPVAYPGGYRFAKADPTGDGDPHFVRNATGGIFVLPWDEVKGRLAAKNPGAFIGGAR